MSKKSKEFYKGITNSIERRIKQHENGQIEFTKRRLPVQLIHVEVSETRKEARVLEKFFKSGYGREIIHQIASEHAAVVEWQTRRT